MKTRIWLLMLWFWHGKTKPESNEHANTLGGWFISEDANNDEYVARMLESFVKF